MPLRRAGAALLALALAGCECGAPAPRAEPAPGASPGATPAPEPAATASPEPIPRGTRVDLPIAIPALTLTITRDAVELDSTALVATWPPADRERVPDAALHVRVEVDGPTPGYRIPAIADAFARMTEADRARAGAAITPSAFAVRVEPTVSWRRVIDGVYSGAASGWSEPRFVLRAPDGREVFLSMPAPRHDGPSAADRQAAADVERVAAEVDRLVRELQGAETPAPAGDRDAPAPPLPTDGAAPLHVVVTGARTVRVSIGARPLAPGCGSVHDAAIDVVPALDPAALGRCLDAARGAGPTISGARFSSDGEIPFGELVPLLETLRARHDVVELTAPM